jgi:hypothetical protein
MTCGDSAQDKRFYEPLTLGWAMGISLAHDVCVIDFSLNMKGKQNHHLRLIAAYN